MSRERQPCVYILASGRNCTIYTGVTSNLAVRLNQHRTGSTPSFAHKHRATKLVVFERYDDMPTAIAREKQLKRWHRDWKLNLIEHDNPEWKDLVIDLGPI